MVALLFDLPAAQARQRGQSPGRQSEPGGVDRLDAEDLAFYDRVREGYLDLSRSAAGRIRVIDSSGTVLDTQRQVAAALSEIFGVA